MGDYRDRGWEYLFSGDGEEFDYDPNEDGSWGYQNDDGSGSYYGADGSWGYRNEDGSRSYYGADGSWGYRNEDGSGSYYGADGSWGYINEDGSGSYYDAEGEPSYYEPSEDDDDEDDDDQDSDSSAGLAELLVDIGIYAYKQHKYRKEQEELEERRKLEEERLRREAKKQRLRERKNKAKFEKSYNNQQRSKTKKWPIVIIVIVVLLGIWLSNNEYDRMVEQKKIKVGYSTSDLVGTNYTTVIDRLQESGFTNVHENRIDDLSYSEISIEGIVTDVDINGNSLFYSTARYPHDARITITYHRVKDAVVPCSSKDAKNKDYQEIEAEFQEAGFQNIKTEAQYDLITGWITKDGSIESVSINGKTSFEEKEAFRPEVEVIITYHTFSRNKES